MFRLDIEAAQNFARLLFLASPAIETGALSLFDLFDKRAAPPTWFACSAIDPISLLEIAGLARGVDKVA